MCFFLFVLYGAVTEELIMRGEGGVVDKLMFYSSER